MPKVLWITGVYCWLNTINGKRYVGSAASERGFDKRRRDHLLDLRKGTHWIRHLQAAWNKYGEGSFEFVVLETCSPERCLEREQHWMDHFQSWNPDKGYNIARIAGSTLGTKRSDETKKKISDKKRGKKLSDAAKANISAGLMGRVPTEKALAAMDWTGRTHKEEAKEKMSEYARNRPAEHRARLSESARKKRLTEEHKRKIGEAGVGRRHTPETLAKLRGRKRSDETKRKIGMAGIGRVVSQETRDKISASLKRRSAMTTVVVDGTSSSIDPFSELFS